jgi:hypothetical protein
MAHAVEEGRKLAFLYPVAVFQIENEALHLSLSFVADDFDVFAVDGSRAGGDAPSQLGDVVSHFSFTKSQIGFIESGEAAVLVISAVKIRGHQ